MASKEILEQGLKKLKNYCDLPDHHLYPIWVIIQLHYDGEFNQLIADEVYNQSYALLAEGGAGDKGLDGYYYDESANKLYLYQSKYPKSEDSTCFIDDARETAIALTHLHNEINGGMTNDSRAEAIESLKRVLELDGEIVIRGISSTTWNQKHLNEMQALVPAELKDKTRCELLGYNEIHALIAEKTEDLANTEVEFEQLNSGAPLIFPNTGRPGLGKAYTAIVSAFSLADVTAKYKHKLFDKNVRQHLGKGSGANKSIRKSLDTEEGRNGFWYGHNGITVLCESITPIADQSGNQIGILTINPQIVNGCQTSMTISDCVGPASARNEPQVDFGILARFIELTGSAEEKENAANEIALNTNNQAAVTIADLKSNDIRQRELEIALLQYGKGWFYERKRGDWNKISSSATRKNRFKEAENEFRRIERDAFQQAWRSFIGMPSDAISNKGDVWKNEETYLKVFSEKRRACDAVLVSTLLNWFGNVLTVKNGQSLSTDIHHGLEEHLEKLKRAKMRAAAHCVALFGYMVKEAYGDYDKYPAEHAESVISKLKRGKFVEQKWVGSGSNKSWGILEDSITLSLKVLAQFITYNVDPRTAKENVTLYGALKEDASFEFMIKALKSERQSEWQDLVTPNS